MRTIIIPCLLSCALASAALTFTGSVSAASTDYRMLGLAMHQETGRNIYLGAISVGADLPNPESLTAAPAPKSMEYRIVARRTSIRSLLGNILLQSEVASGNPPGPETVAFADKLLSSIKGSLYAGDSLAIIQDESEQLAVHLNGIELFQGDHSGVFAYLLMGWVGESGPSSAFRNTILETDLDSSLLSAYNAHTPSDERLAVVTTWVEPVVDATPPAATAAVVQPAADASTSDALLEVPVADDSVIADAETTGAVTASALGVAAVDASSAAVALPKIAPDTAIAGTDLETGSVEPDLTLASGDIAETDTSTDAIEQSEEKAPESDIDTTASIAILDEPVVDAATMPSDNIQTLDVTEYSYRLAGFNTALIKLVYSKIQYPRRAVRREIEGALELDITLLEDGSLIDVAVAESSGHKLLDGAAVAAAEQALAATSMGEIDPVAIAEYSNGDRLVIPVPVAFVLQ